MAFYYNSFNQKFEPIYYDGNLGLNSKIILDEKKLKFIKKKYQ